MSKFRHDLNQEAFDEFVAYRKRIGDELTELSAKKLATRMRNYEPLMQDVLVRQAIYNEWLSLWRDFVPDDIRHKSTNIEQPLKKPPRIKKEKWIKF